MQQWSWILSKNLQRNKNKRWHDGNVDINWLHLQRLHYGNTAVNGLNVTKLCLEFSFYRFSSSCSIIMLTNYIRSHYNAAWILLQIHTFICHLQYFGWEWRDFVMALIVCEHCSSILCTEQNCYWKNYYYQGGGGKHNLYGFSNCWTGNELWNSYVKHSFLVTFTPLDLLYWS